MVSLTLSQRKVLTRSICAIMVCVLSMCFATSTQKVHAQTADTPFYRLYKSSTGDHFYTTSADERDNAIAYYGYVSEGTACTVFSYQAEGTTPLYRLFRSSANDHFYTTSTDELNAAVW